MLNKIDRRKETKQKILLHTSTHRAAHTLYTRKFQEKKHNRESTERNLEIAELGNKLIKLYDKNIPCIVTEG